MTDTNTFNYQDYIQGQTINLDSNQIPIQTTTKIIKDNTHIDPSTYIQGDSAVLQASAGLGNIPTENYEYITQNNEVQPTTYDTNVNYGETFQTTTEIPGTYEQTFQGTTNAIDGNNYFTDNNAFTNNVTSSNEIQGNNIDLNSYFTNNNTDTNVIYGQTQVPQTTTTTTTTTTATNYNTLYDPNQNIQGTTTYGETQILPQTDTNTYIDNTQLGGTYQTTNQIDFGQPTKQNDYVSYQTGALTDLNNYNFDTSNKTQQINTTTDPLTQAQTTTTTTTTNITTEPQVIPQYQTQNYTTQVQNIFSNPTLSETKYIQPQQQYDLSQFQNVNALPTNTPINVNQTETQITQTQEQANIPQQIPQTQYQTTQTTTTTTTNTYNTPTQQEVQTPQAQTIFSKQQVPNIINKPQPQQQIIELNKNNGSYRIPLMRRVFDEDFARGRPVYKDQGVIRPSDKLKIIDNRITYKPRSIYSHENIGLSRLTPSMSYDRAGQITSTINPNINSNVGNVINNQINAVNNNVVANIDNIRNNIGNNINNINNNINTGLDKITKASSYNIGAQAITPALNNANLNQNNTLIENNKIENLKNYY